MAPNSLFSLVVFAILLNTQLRTAGARNLGVCYGSLASDLPPPEQARLLCDIYKFGRMRIYAPDHKVFRALNGSNVQLTVGIPNHKVYGIAKNITEAENWFHNHIEPYVGSVRFRNIVVGHDDVITENSAQDVLQAMTNLHTILSNHSLQNDTRITTEVGLSVLGSYDLNSSDGAFRNSSKAGLYMEPIVNFLASHGAPLFIINYPYPILHAQAMRTNDSTPISFDGDIYPVDIFVSIVDVFYSALEKIGGKDVRVVVGETGWPWAGDNNLATTANAETYAWDMSVRSLSGIGTTKRPDREIETYVYSLFNENLRDGVWQNYGMFYANMTPIFQIPDVL